MIELTPGKKTSIVKNMVRLNGEEAEEIDGMEQDQPHDVQEEVRRIPPWKKQITVRGIIASIAIGIIYSVIVMKLNLTTGLVPNLNVSAALLAFVFIGAWTKMLQKAGFVSTPFTRQENTVIQTCAVACYSIAVGGQSPRDNKKQKQILKNSLGRECFLCLYALLP